MLTARWTGTHMRQVSVPEFISDIIFTDSGFLVSISCAFFTVPLLSYWVCPSVRHYQLVWQSNSQVQSSNLQLNKNSRENHGNNHTPHSPSHFWAVHHLPGHLDLILPLPCAELWIRTGELWEEIQGPSVQTQLLQSFIYSSLSESD